MSLRRISESFQTTDGYTFDVKSDAEAHQQRIDAHKAVLTAWDTFCDLCKNESTTADGKRFEFGRRYWHVVDTGIQKARIVELRPGRLDQLHFDNGDLFLFDQEREHQKNYPCRFKISSLFASEQLAHQAAQLANMRLIETIEEENRQLAERWGNPCVEDDSEVPQ